MCGIAGSIAFQPTEAAALDLELIRHRGPDAGGEWRSLDGKVWLGHRRLSILDLSPCGAQPMTDPATGNVIVYNGEVYNHLDLRKTLEREGATFQGTSDTETILVAYRYWKVDLLRRLDGMFAFAVYDAATGNVLLARDRTGIKPIYLHRSPEGLFFCSETRPLVSRFHLPVSREGITTVLQHGCCTHHRLLFEELTEVPAGSALEVFPDGLTRESTFWPPRQVARSEYASLTADTAPVVLRGLLEKAVASHLLSDVPVATFLSGGIDSSIVTALAARATSEKITTFSVGFAEAKYDESPFAEKVAQAFGTNHRHILLSEEEVIENVKEAVLAMDLPSRDAINTYIVVKQAARAGFKVTLSGLGGDELFGGYDTFRMAPKVKWLALVPAPLRELLLATGKFRHALSDVPARVDAGLAAIWWRRMWNHRMLREAGLTPLPYSLDAGPELADDFARISWAEIRHYMRDMLLRDSDQMSMAVSVELRVPLLDNSLIDFALSLPASVKQAGAYTKPLLVESMKDLLPREVYDRKKQGFELPMPVWMKGPLRQFSKEGLNHLRGSNVLRPEAIDRMESEFLAGRQSWQALWVLVVLGWKLGLNPAQTRGSR